MEEPSIFEERLRELRIIKGASQAEIGKATGIPQQSLSRWESGESGPRPHEMRALASYFGCTTDYLCGASDKPNPETLPPSHWIINLDVCEHLLEHGRNHSIPGGKWWAVAIPSRSRIVSSSEYAAMYDALPSPGKRRRRT